MSGQVLRLPLLLRCVLNVKAARDSQSLFEQYPNEECTIFALTGRVSFLGFVELEANLSQNTRLVSLRELRLTSSFYINMSSAEKL